MFCVWCGKQKELNEVCLTCLKRSPLIQCDGCEALVDLSYSFCPFCGVRNSSKQTLKDELKGTRCFRKSGEVIPCPDRFWVMDEADGQFTNRWSSGSHVSFTSNLENVVTFDPDESISASLKLSAQQKQRRGLGLKKEKLIPPPKKEEMTRSEPCLFPRGPRGGPQGGPRGPRGGPPPPTEEETAAQEGPKPPEISRKRNSQNQRDQDEQPEQIDYDRQRRSSGSCVLLKIPENLGVRPEPVPTLSLVRIRCPHLDLHTSARPLPMTPARRGPRVRKRPPPEPKDQKEPTGEEEERTEG